ncbi:hypothetical protein SNEBB_002899 [Seison nebaliae]|nr:hypothetical protein SNEBB_002899 [Seison nebaliae]
MHRYYNKEYDVDGRRLNDQPTFYYSNDNLSSPYSYDNSSFDRSAYHIPIKNDPLSLNDYTDYYDTTTNSYISSSRNSTLRFDKNRKYIDYLDVETPSIRSTRYPKSSYRRTGQQHSKIIPLQLQQSTIGKKDPYLLNARRDYDDSIRLHRPNIYGTKSSINDTYRNKSTINSSYGRSFDTSTMKEDQRYHRDKVPVSSLFKEKNITNPTQTAPNHKRQPTNDYGTQTSLQLKNLLRLESDAKKVEKIKAEKERIERDIRNPSTSKETSSFQKIEYSNKNNQNRGYDTRSPKPPLNNRYQNDRIRQSQKKREELKRTSYCLPNRLLFWIGLVLALLSLFILILTATLFVQYYYKYGGGDNYTKETCSLAIYRRYDSVSRDSSLEWNLRNNSRNFCARTCDSNKICEYVYRPCLIINVYVWENSPTGGFNTKLLKNLKRSYNNTHSLSSDQVNNALGRIYEDEYHEQKSNPFCSFYVCGSVAQSNVVDVEEYQDRTVDIYKGTTTFKEINSPNYQIISEGEVNTEDVGDTNLFDCWMNKDNNFILLRRVRYSRSDALHALIWPIVFIVIGLLLMAMASFLL